MFKGRFLSFFCSILLFKYTLLFSQLLYGWGATGHEAVCQIALEELSQKARQSVINIMSSEADPRFKNFHDSCVWPDYRGPQRSRNKDHYVNVPRNWYYVKYEKCVNSSECLFTAIRQDVSVLKNGSSSDKEKLEALKFLGHWVGDIHQPLHVSFSDDRGGNRITLGFGIGCSRNLHSVWDTCIPEDLMKEMGFNPNDADERKEFGIKLQQGVTQSQRKEWAGQSSLAVWATESLEIARNPEVLYCMKKNQGNQCWYSDDEVEYHDHNTQERELQLNSSYEDQFQDVVKLRIQQAGIRLGAMLNEIFDS